MIQLYYNLKFDVFAMVKLSSKMRYLLKYGFVAFILAVIFVSVIPVKQDWLDLVDENLSAPNIDEKFSVEILREDVTLCLTQLKQVGIQETHVSPEDTLISLKKVSDNDSEDKPTIISLLASFNNLLSLHKVKTVIIEPSILYCMLLPKYQDLLLKRRFNISHFLKSKHIITYGILSDDVPILQQERSLHNFSEMDFQPYFVQSPLADWMLKQRTHFKFETFPSHIFYKHTFCVIHLVVFHDRGSYFWHSAIESQSNGKIPTRDKLNFVDHNGAYEKFGFVSLENKVWPIADFYIPTCAHYFLFEMLSSRFLECNFSRAANVTSLDKPQSHPKMSVGRFNRRTRIAIRELKKIFHPLLMNLWIWSGTMLGWYRQCDIIPYTTDVDFASWAFDVEDLNIIIEMLLNNKYISIKERMGILEEALEFNIDCHNLRVDIFFMYQMNNGSWCSGHKSSEGLYFRCYYPPFTICSAELLGAKVQVPCETEDVIIPEYGPNWSKPISLWLYDASIKNRGPDIYWEKKRLKYVYKFY